jgi:hypothetical protein
MAAAGVTLRRPWWAASAAPAPPTRAFGTAHPNRPENLALTEITGRRFCEVPDQ